jgi:hypothetical protein
MSRKALAATIAAIGLAFASLTPSAPAAGGVPVSGVAPDQGVPGPGGVRYVARTVDATTTVRELSASAKVIQSEALAGTLLVPAVTVDGTGGGLSADGGTLVLAKPRTSIPQAETHLVVLRADGLEVRERLRLKGDFGFDAISPDASRLYLIEYLSARDPTRYAVRAYDLRSRRLLAEPIVDPDEEDPDEMRGYPLTRAVSADGRWVYTLYDGGGEHPFVHALDTVDGRAVCIDTPSLASSRDLYRLGLGVSSDGSTLTVADRGRALALIDTRTFEVRGPSDPAPSAPAGGHDSWRLIIPAAAVVALAGSAFALIARRRGLPAPGDA